MKALTSFSNFLLLIVIVVTFGFPNLHATVFGKHHKGKGGKHHPGLHEPHVPLPVPGAQPVPGALPGAIPVPEAPSDKTYEIYIINQASAGLDTLNVTCNPGAPPGPPGGPPGPPCGPPVEPHLLKVGERFSWTFDYPDPSTDISYSCIFDWPGNNKGLVTLFDKDTYTDGECKGDKGNHCYWTVAPDGFYFNRDDTPYPGPGWTFRWPWGM